MPVALQGRFVIDVDTICVCIDKLRIRRHKAVRMCSDVPFSHLRQSQNEVNNAHLEDSIFFSPTLRAKRAGWGTKRLYLGCVCEENLGLVLVSK